MSKKSTKRVGRKTNVERKKTKKRVSKQSSKFFAALSKLKRMKSVDQREALRQSNDAFIRQLCTHIKKLRHANLSPSLKKRVMRQKKNLRKLILPKTSIRMKRKMLAQRGGFVPLLLAALPAVGAMVGNIIAGAGQR